MGKFHGVNAATGPIGSFNTSCCAARLRDGTMRPYTRRPSSANHSMMSAPANTSPRASAKGLPCSSVNRRAMSAARSRSRPAALRMVAARSFAGIFFHTSKPACAAASARSRSAMPACATLPITLPVAGFTTSSVLPLAAAHHSLLMRSCVSL